MSMNASLAPTFVALMAPVATCQEPTAVPAMKVLLATDFNAQVKTTY